MTRGELGPNRNVIWIGSEDSASIDIKPRMLAANGDCERVHVVTSGWVQLPRDIDQIDEEMTKVGEIGLLVIDPVGNHMTGKSSNSESDVREVIAPLNALADKHRSMVFAVRHLSEKEASRGVLAAILGSSAWTQVPRVVIAVVRDSEDPNVSHVQCVAGNRLPPDTPGRMFRIEGVLLPGLENEVTRATWIGDSGQDVEAMLAATGDREPSKSAKARELILDILGKTPQMESDALDARVAQETGISAGTVRNLRVGLGKAGLIRSIPERDEHGGVIQWNVARTLAPDWTPAQPEGSS